MSLLNQKRNEDDQEEELELVFDQRKTDHREIENTFIRERIRT
jgi:hypothetical protein